MKTYDFSTIIEDCYNQALSKRNTHFAIKANKDCYTSSVAHETYDKHGLASGCVRGRGGEDIITVYKLLPRDNGTDLSKTITSTQKVILGEVVSNGGGGAYLTPYVWPICLEVICISNSEKKCPKMQFS